MGRKVIDLIGKRFGKLVVVSESQERKNGGSVQWKCQCDCGGIKITSSNVLRQGKCKSCGCNRLKDLSGQRFGKWTVLEKSQTKTKQGKTQWICQCDCGEIKEVVNSNLNQGKSNDCGCSRRKDLTGKKFGRLTVVGMTKERSQGNVIWECKCECGLVTNTVGARLTRGMTQSCGCLQVEKARETIKTGANNPRYNPNLTDEERLKNRYQLHGTNLTSWRRKVYSTDHHTCQGCGNDTSGNLNAHHLNSWNAFPEQRFDTANGITLCKDCHKEYHHFNGYGDNTLEEFRDHLACTVGEEYISEIEETLLSRESEIIGQEVEQKETRELQTT